MVFLMVFLMGFPGGFPTAHMARGEEMETAGREMTAAETPGPETGSAEAEEGNMKNGEAYPTVIDRWTNPEACPGFSFSGEDDLLEIWFPRIRDRDAAILLYQGECWMIDCSDYQATERVVPLLQALEIEQIDKMVNTHPHHDHIDGFRFVADAVPVKELMICFPEDVNENMMKAVSYADKHGIRITQFGDEQILCMGDGLVRLKVWMKSSDELDMNEQSAQIMVSYGDRDILFMADLGREGEAQLEAAVPREELKADIIRYPHHGKEAMIPSLYDAIDPDFAIITSTEMAPESRQAARFLASHRTPAAFTTAGYLHLATDGVHWLCEKATGDWLPAVSLVNER